jgi:hypothetical protein
VSKCGGTSGQVGIAGPLVIQHPCCSEEARSGVVVVVGGGE